MKFRILLSTIVFAFFSISGWAQTVQSDYEIQENFKTKYAEFQDSIETVSSPENAQELIESIKAFDEKYSSHSELLNKALHPDTYQQRMDELKESSVVAHNRLKRIGEQTEKLQELEKKLTSYEGNIEQLNKQTDSLQEAMEKSVQSEKQLSSMLREYRNNLEKRDDLILAFIDSMVVAYQQMDLEALQDLESINKKSRIDSDGNALKMIRDISAENLAILENNNENLRLQDYMRMSEVHHQFSTMWTRLGDKIQDVYDGENAEELAAEVDENITTWNQRLKTQTFATLRDSLSEQNIQMDQFTNADEFYTSFNSYLDTQIAESRENNTEAGYEEFQRFQEFWNPIELQWSDNFVEADIIEREELATINQKVDTWAEHAQPKSNNILVYLLGATVLLAVALGVMWIREKKNTS